MLRLSIHTFFIATLMTSVAAFAIGDDHDSKDRASKTEADVAIQQTVRDAFLRPGEVKLEGDKMFQAAYSVLSIKDSNKKVDPELRKILDISGSVQEKLFAQASPTTVAFIKNALGGQKTSSNSNDAVANKYFAKQTAALIVVQAVNDGEGALKDWDPNDLKQMPSAYSYDAKRNAVGIVTYALLAKLNAVMDNQPSSPSKSLLDGGTKWIMHVKKIPESDARKEANDLLEKGCLGTKAVGA